MRPFGLLSWLPRPDELFSQSAVSAGRKLPPRLLPLLLPIWEDLVAFQPEPAVVPDSVHWLCLQCAQARIQALELAGISDAAVAIRKLAVDRILGALKQGGLGVPLPCVLLVPEVEQQDPAQGVNDRDDVEYGVACLQISLDNQEPSLAAGMSGHLQRRQQINRAFRNQGPDTIDNLPPTIIDVTVETRALYDRQDWLAGFDVSYLLLRFRSREPRGLNQ